MRRRIVTLLVFVFVGFAVWCVNGLHFGKQGFDPRADENSEGQCP